ncbi:hypothetical protein [Nocardioides exalbidus]|uniref:hypothetical protein n=1 Tax=Nocardioides exalbidus TaxID=402596 RepID=UPI000B84C3E6|nr:hypothetical protein [Nocardioides exalbidus]
MWRASTSSSSRPASAAARAACSNSGRDPASSPAERSNRPRSSATRTTPSGSAASIASSTACPSAYLSCSPSARATCVMAYAADGSPAVAARARKRSSEPAGSSKSQRSWRAGAMSGA